MGSVCAGTLALMDAGVPIKTPIAGISIGLVTSDNGEHVILTDIQGLEDHIGDMDFKVAGSEAGITAIQLDIKVKNISMTIIREALETGQRGAALPAGPDKGDHRAGPHRAEPLRSPHDPA